MIVYQNISVLSRLLIGLLHSSTPAGGFLSSYNNGVLNDRSIPTGRSYILPGLFIDVHLTGPCRWYKARSMVVIWAKLGPFKGAVHN